MVPLQMPKQKIQNNTIFIYFQIPVSDYQPLYVWPNALLIVVKVSHMVPKLCFFFLSAHVCPTIVMKRTICFCAVQGLWLVCGG